MASVPRPFTIGDLALRAGVGVETVRFYERKGLIARPPRPDKGYRSYPPDAADRIRFIRQAQELGFSLREIAVLLSLRAEPRADCADVRARAEAKRADVEEKIARFTRMRGALETLLAACSGEGAAASCSILQALSGTGGDGRE